MEIVRGYPPNINDIVGKFKTTLDVVFTYGDVLYNPSGAEISKSLMAHETTHSKQQLAMGTEEWWKSYLEIPAFRLDREVEAYSAQYKEYCKSKKNVLKQYLFLSSLAEDLSSPLYGNLVDFETAKSLIHNYEVK